MLICRFVSAMLVEGVGVVSFGSMCSVPSYVIPSSGCSGLMLGGEFRRQDPRLCCVLFLLFCCLC